MAYAKIGTEISVSSAGVIGQYYPSIASLASGGFVTVWMNDTNAVFGDGSSSQIKSQTFDGNGAPVGDAVIVGVQAAYDFSVPKVAGLVGGGHIVVWTDIDSRYGDDEATGVVYQIFDATGQATGAIRLANSQTAKAQYDPSVAKLANGGFVITWADKSGAANNSDADIKAQIFDAAGNKVDAEFRVNTQTSDAQYSPSVAGSPDGSFMVTWYDYGHARGDDSAPNIKAQKFSADGGKIGDEFMVNQQTTGIQYLPVVTALANGDYLFTWIDNGLHFDSDDGSYSSVKAILYTAAGGIVSTEFRVNTETSGRQFNPTATVLSDGGFVISWPDESLTLGDKSGLSVKAQIYDATGKKVGTEFLVNSGTEGDQAAPSIAALANGKFVVAWTNDPSPLGDAAGMSTKAQIFGPGGQVAEKIGTDGVDTLNGTNGADRLSGLKGDDRLNGNAGDDTLYGNAGNDYIDGGEGRDVMIGDYGDDVYVVDNLFDQVIEGAYHGRDLVVTRNINVTLWENVENLLIMGTNGRIGTGNALANKMTGGEGADTLYGLDGADLLIGGGGDDNLFGGAGADIFQYHALSDASASDHIRDFNGAEGDLIDLSILDGMTNLSGNNRFTWIGSASFGKHEGELRYQLVGTSSLVQGDVNGDGRADFSIVLANTALLEAEYFIL